MLFDESTFRLLRGESKVVQRPSGVSRYDAHPDSVMLWGAFSGNFGRRTCTFSPLRNHEWKQVFKSPATTSDAVLAHSSVHTFHGQWGSCTQDQGSSGVAERQEIPVLHWPGNCPGLNPTENAWNEIKNKVQDVQPSSMGKLQAVRKDFWVHRDNFVKL